MMFLRYVCVVMIGICSPYLSTQVKELKGKTAGKVVEYVRLVRKKGTTLKLSACALVCTTCTGSAADQAVVPLHMYNMPFMHCSSSAQGSTIASMRQQRAQKVWCCVCVCVCKWCTGHCDIVHHSDTGAGAPLPQEVGGGLQPPCLLEGVWLGMWCGRSLTAQWCTLCVLLRHSRVPTSTPPPPAPAHACSGQVCSTQLCVTHGYAPHAST